MSVKKNISYEINPSTGCLIVDSHKPNAGGYLYINQLFEKDYLHRIVYRENFGDIPEGFEVRHICGEKRCINASHLFLFNRRNLKDN